MTVWKLFLDFSGFDISSFSALDALSDFLLGAVAVSWVSEGNCHVRNQSLPFGHGGGFED